ncbi:MAG: glycosyltransferase [Candidatus Methanodesulfokora sp.]
MAALISLLYTLAFLLLTGHQVLSIRRVPSLSREIEMRPISVIVPARNEEESIPKLIRCLKRQKADFEAIIVDDCSEDSTYEVALREVCGDKRFTVIKTEGRAGKSSACFSGYLRSRNEILVFIDADVEFDEYLLCNALATMRKLNADVITLIPKICCKGFFCSVTEIALSSFIRTVFPYWKRSREDAWLFGSFIMIKRDVYEAVGGHKAVISSIVEDRELGRILARRGFSVHMVRSNGRLITCWHEGFSNVVNSIIRISSFDINVPLVYPVIAAVSVLLAAFIPFLLIISMDPLVFLPPMIALYLFSSISLLLELRVKPFYMVFLPVGAVVLSYSILKSWTDRRRGVPWRGRVVMRVSDAIKTR